MRRIRPILLVLLVAATCASCMGTPTLPAPPPKQDLFYSMDAPDADGFVTVEAGPGAFQEWDMEANRVYGIVINQDTHRGVIEPVGMDGSFHARIEASSGDRLSVYSRQADGTESPPIEFTVPF